MSTSSETRAQSLDVARIRAIFPYLESGTARDSWNTFADNMNWPSREHTAGHHNRNADFLTHTFEKPARVLPGGAQLHVQNGCRSGNRAVVGLPSEATRTGLGSMITIAGFAAFEDGKILEVRASRFSARRPKIILSSLTPA